MVRSLAGDEPKPAVRGGGHAAVRGTDVMTVMMVTVVVLVRHGLIRCVRSTEFSVMPKLFSRSVSASVSSAFEPLLCYVRRMRARSIDLVTIDSDVDTDSVHARIIRRRTAPQRLRLQHIGTHTHTHTAPMRQFAYGRLQQQTAAFSRCTANTSLLCGRRACSNQRHQTFSPPSHLPHSDIIIIIVIIMLA